jgi:hypothetical protein
MTIRAMAHQDRDLVGQYAEIHRSRRYGDTSIKNLRFLRPAVRLLKPRSILDYGCGQSRLLEALVPASATRLLRYDPAIPEYAALPVEKAELLVNIDVLEHIPEEHLDATLREMRALCDHAIVIVDTRPAALVLPDGRNAHVTLRPHEWWRTKLQEFFPVVVPIRAVRRSRAAFRTWRLSPAEAVRFRLLRCGEDVRHYAARARRFLGGPSRKG